MKTLEELKARFASIQDLPVSEEMLGAYIEGNLNGADLRDVQNFINSDQSILDMIEVVESPMSFCGSNMEYEYSSEELYNDHMATIEDVYLPIDLLEEMSVSIIDGLDFQTENLSLIDIELHQVDDMRDPFDNMDNLEDLNIDFNTLE